MAVNRADRYPGRWDTETTEYPLGVPKNRTSSTSNDGSYFEKDWISDYEGFFGALMTEAGLTADGTADTATDSQFYDALVAAILANAPVDDLVDLSSEQSISGVKTFTESPIVPTPITDFQAATKEYVDGLALGAGQTWQDVTASRSESVTYTNTTGRTITLYAEGVFSSGSGAAGIVITIDGEVFSQLANGITTSSKLSVSLPVPNGSEYSFEIWSDTNSYIIKELR